MCEGQAPCLLISLFGEGWRFARDASACALCSQALCGSSSSDDVASHREINATLLNSMSKHIRSCHVGPCVGLSPRSPRRGPAVRPARSRLDNVFDSVQRALMVSGAARRLICSAYSTLSLSLVGGWASNSMCGRAASSFVGRFVAASRSSRAASCGGWQWTRCPW